jgi:hypothetical protein
MKHLVKYIGVVIDRLTPGGYSSDVERKRDEIRTIQSYAVAP